MLVDKNGNECEYLTTQVTVEQSRAFKSLCKEQGGDGAKAVRLFVEAFLAGNCKLNAVVSEDKKKVISLEVSHGSNESTNICK